MLTQLLILLKTQTVKSPYLPSNKYNQVIYTNKLESNIQGRERGRGRGRGGLAPAFLLFIKSVVESLQVDCSMQETYISS